MLDAQPQGTCTLRQRDRPSVDPLGDRPQTVGPVVDRVHRSDDREERLRRADVARRLLAADVLLTGLQRETVGGVAVGVDAHPDEAAGEHPLDALADRHERGVRSAVEERHPEALGRAHRDVRADLAGCREDRQGEEVGRHRDERTGRLRRVDERCELARPAARAELLDDEPHHVRTREAGVGERCCDAERVARRQVGDDDGQPDRLGATLGHRERLREEVGVEDDDPRSGRWTTLRGAPHERHGLSDRGRLVEERGVGDVEAGEVADDRLEVEERLEPPLGDLRLIGRVGRVPGWALEDAAADDGRGDRVVVAETDHLRARLVLRRETAKVCEHLGLGERCREVERALEPDRCRHRRVDERVDGRVPEVVEHDLDVVRPVLAVGAGSDVPVDEAVSRGSGADEGGGHNRLLEGRAGAARRGHGTLPALSSDQVTPPRGDVPVNLRVWPVAVAWACPFGEVRRPLAASRRACCSELPRHGGTWA